MKDLFKQTIKTFSNSRNYCISFLKPKGKPFTTKMDLYLKRNKNHQILCGSNLEDAEEMRNIASKTQILPLSLKEADFTDPTVWLVQSNKTHHPVKENDAHNFKSSYGKNNDFIVTQQNITVFKENQDVIRKTTTLNNIEMIKKAENAHQQKLKNNLEQHNLNINLNINKLPKKNNGKNGFGKDNWEKSNNAKKLENKNTSVED